MRKDLHNLNMERAQENYFFPNLEGCFVPKSSTSRCSAALSRKRPPVSMTSQSVACTAFSLSTDGVLRVHGLDARNSRINPSWPDSEKYIQITSTGGSRFVRICSNQNSLKGYPHQRWIGIRHGLGGRSAISMANQLFNSGPMPIHLQCGWAFEVIFSKPHLNPCRIIVHA